MEKNRTCAVTYFLFEDGDDILGILCSTVAPIAVLFNLVTLIGIIKYHRLHTKSLLSLANLSMCAMMSGLAQPMHSMVLLGGIQSNEIWCKVAFAFEMIEDTVLCCSFLTICFVAVERYVSIFHPFKQERWLSKAVAVQVIFAIWCFSLLNSALLLLWNEAKYIMYFVVLTITSAGALWVCVVYLKILLLVRSIKRRVADSERRFSTNSIARRIRHESKRTWPTVLVIFSFIAYFIIHKVFLLLKKMSLKNKEELKSKLYGRYFAWSWLFFLLLSSLTPVTLWMSNSQIRWYMKRLYANFLCTKDDLSSAYETRDSRLTKLLGNLLISQRLFLNRRSGTVKHRHSNNDHNNNNAKDLTTPQQLRGCRATRAPSVIEEPCHRRESVAIICH